MVSVIVPVYKGGRYIDRIVEMLARNVRNMKTGGHEVELIFVNDYPEDTSISTVIADVMSKRSTKSLTVRLIQNVYNLGIHGSRVNGLRESKGEYVIFLDQDDEISANHIATQLQSIGTSDVVVGNGIEQGTDYSKYLYKYSLMHYTVRHIWFYTRFDCRIISPGQCMIRKNSIPAYWCEHIVSNNGSDDYMLWLLMLAEGRKFAINREVIYTHVYTEHNVSLDKKIMNKSVREVADLIREQIGEHNYELIQKRLLGEKSSLVKIVEHINRR